MEIYIVLSHKLQTDKCLDGNYLFHKRASCTMRMYIHSSEGYSIPVIVYVHTYIHVYVIYVHKCDKFELYSVGIE